MNLRALFLIGLLIFATEAFAKKSLSFGIVPQQSAKRLAATWGPIIEELQQKTGLDIKFATAPSIPVFESRMAAQVYDIAYMNPYHYALFSGPKAYRAIAKQSNKQIKGIIVVPTDSHIQTLEDLNKQEMAFPAPLSFAATLVTKSTLERAGIQVKPHYVQSHDSVYMGVARGFFPAGGGVVRTLSTTSSAVSAKLRILWESPGFTPHAIAVSSNVSAEHAAKISEALYAITDASLLDPIAFSGFSKASDSDWDSIRELNINATPDSSR